jgi:hypothetical protein
VRDSAGNQLGSGFVQVTPEAGGARFVISANYRTISGGGLIFFDVFVLDPASGTTVASATVSLQQAP